MYPYQIPTVFISSGASNHALFAQFLKVGREYICFKNFSECEIKKSSTWRELLTIQFALHSFAPKISYMSVHWETDNYAASLIVASGSNKELFLILAEDKLLLNILLLLQKKTTTLQTRRKVNLTTSMTEKLLTPYSTTLTAYGALLL